MAKAKVESKVAVTPEVKEELATRLHSIISEVETLEKQYLMASLEGKGQETMLLTISMGGLLSRLSGPDKDVWADQYTNFSEMVDGLLGWKPAKAYYFRDIYESVSNSSIPISKMAILGINKLAMLSSILTIDNIDFWLDVLSTVLSRDKKTIRQYVEAYKAGGKDGVVALKYPKPQETVSPTFGQEEKEPEPREKGNTPVSVGNPKEIVIPDREAPLGDDKITSDVKGLTFKLHPDQSEIVKEGLLEAKERFNTEFDNVAITNVMLDFMGKSHSVLVQNVKSAIPLSEHYALILSKLTDSDKSGFAVLFDGVSEKFPEWFE